MSSRFATCAMTLGYPGVCAKTPSLHLVLRQQCRNTGYHKMRADPFALDRRHIRSSGQHKAVSMPTFRPMAMSVSTRSPTIRQSAGGPRLFQRRFSGQSVRLHYHFRSDTRAPLMAPIIAAQSGISPPSTGQVRSALVATKRAPLLCIGRRCSAWHNRRCDRRPPLPRLHDNHVRPVLQ